MNDEEWTVHKRLLSDQRPAGFIPGWFLLPIAGCESSLSGESFVPRLDPPRSRRLILDQIDRDPGREGLADAILGSLASLDRPMQGDAQARARCDHLPSRLPRARELTQALPVGPVGFQGHIQLLTCQVERSINPSRPTVDDNQVGAVTRGDGL